MGAMGATVADEVVVSICSSWRASGRKQNGEVSFAMARSGDNDGVLFEGVEAKTVEAAVAEGEELVVAMAELEEEASSGFQKRPTCLSRK